MSRVIFHDPFVDEGPFSIEPPTGMTPVPAPPRTPAPAARALPSQGREREVQQLIYDLAVLAAEQNAAIT
jgi:hypothetical protein